MSFSDEEERRRLFEKLPFYDPPIEKPKIKKLDNVDRLLMLPFYVK